MTIIVWPGKKLSNKKKKRKTKRNIGYKTQMVMEPPNHSEIKTRRYHNTKKKKMSNFNNILEEEGNSSEEPERLTLIKNLQSYIKQVVGDTTDPQSTLSSSTGYTFGAMVKLVILLGIEL